MLPIETHGAVANFELPKGVSSALRRLPSCSTGSFSSRSNGVVSQTSALLAESRQLAEKVQLPKGDDPRTDHRRGADSKLPGWHPKENASSLPKAGYDCLNNGTVEQRPDAVVWASLVGQPADYLLPGTVGQWPPATGQWWNERRGGDPKTDQWYG